MSQALDYSLARPSPASIKAAGYVGVLRYVAPVGKPSGPAFGGADDSAKVITKPEYDALLAHGLEVALNWEWYGNRAREGAAAGHADATEALRQADALNYGGCIYFSVDYDAPESDQPALDAYFAAVANVIGKQRTGAYGGYWPVSRLFDIALIVYGWQTIAWSGGNRESRAHLYQTGQQALGACDVNDVLKPDWTGGVAPMPPTPPVNHRIQQANDLWASTAYPAGTAIHAVYLAHYQLGEIGGPPLTAEIHTVDWSGTPIIAQFFGSGTCIQYYPGTGTSHGYSFDKQLW